MLKIIILACSIHVPSECMNYELPMFDLHHLFQCQMVAHLQLADWKKVHPDKEIKKFECINDKE